MTGNLSMLEGGCFDASRFAPATEPPADTADLVDDFVDLPDEMRQARRWLVWKSIPQPGKKPRKVPYYVDGTARGEGVELDSPADLARLASLDEAAQALAGGRYAGLGFALGPDGTGNYWQGVDLDNLSEHPGVPELAEDLPSYTEFSPSGAGMHAIGYGRHFESMGSNGRGIEAYASGRFFTVTGEGAGIQSPICLADFVEARLAPMHNRGKEGAAASTPLGEWVPPAVVTELRSALLHIRADDRKLWVDVGLALKTLGDVGRGLWLDWSATSLEKWDPADAAAKWETFRPSRTGYQAVFAKARERGWLNPMSSEAGSAGTLKPAQEQARRQRSAFQIISIADVALTPPDYIVKPYVERATTECTFGDTEAGKTFIELDLWAHVAATAADGNGWHFDTWHGCPIRQHGWVLHICAEGANGIRRRIEAFALQHELDVRAQLAGYCISRMGTDFNDAEAVADVMAAVAAHVEARDGEPPVAVIVDTMTRNMSGEENTATDIARFYNGIETLRDTYGCAVRFIHHCGHGDPTRPRGSRAIAQNADQTARVVRNGDLRVLIPLKQKDGPRPPSIGFRGVEHVVAHDDDGLPVTSLAMVREEVAEGDDLSGKAESDALMRNEFERKILAALVYAADNSMSLTAADIRKKAGIPSSATTSKYLPKMVEAGLLATEGEGRKQVYWPTDAGRDGLAERGG